MSTRLSFSIVLVSAILFLACGAAADGWPLNGRIVCVAEGNQYFPQVVSDPLGNTVTAWLDFRNGWGGIYAQRIDNYGNVKWDYNGILVGRSIYAEDSPISYMLCLINEESETIIAWDGEVNGVTGVYAQKLDPLGNFLWGADGAFIGPGSLDNAGRSIVSDGSGGIIIAWVVDRGSTSRDVCAQRIGDTGNLVWGSQGVLVCGAVLDQRYPIVATDLNGGAVIAWMDLRMGSAFDIFAQRISAAGDVLWVQDGVPLCTAPGGQFSYYLSTIDTDGKGGAIVTWRDTRRVADIYAQRVDAAGNIRWDPNGLAVCDAVGTQSMPELASDGAGGAYFTWYDIREPENYDIFAQRVDSLGVKRWVGVVGKPVCRAPGWQLLPRIIANNPEACYIMWEDKRNGNSDIYAQKLDAATGDPEWPLNGVAVCAVANDQIGPHLAVVNGGDIVVVWQDRRDGEYDIYAKYLTAAGEPIATLLQSFAASFNGTGITLTWTLSQMDEAPRFSIERAAATAEAYAEVASSDVSREGSSFTFVDVVLNAGTAYRYRVSLFEGG